MTLPIFILKSTVWRINKSDEKSKQNIELTEWVSEWVSVRVKELWTVENQIDKKLEEKKKQKKKEYKLSDSFELCEL